jgi:putative endonuclease
MTTARQAIGAFGERLAEQHLRDQGMAVLDRNWRCADGEVDLILRDGDTVVFCEVKTRRVPASGIPAFGTPAEAIGRTKVRRLRRLAARWLTQSGLHPNEVRFDVVAVLTPPRGASQVEHVRAAF